MIDVPALKRMAFWGVPLMLFLIWLGAWSTIYGLVPMIRDIAEQQASLRIRSLGFLQPIGTVVALVTLVAVILRIWRFDKAVNWVERRIMIPVVVIMLILIPVLIIGGSLLQRHYLPRMGYHYCDKLNDNPSVWFNDWVKDPELCISKKTHEWVREQAARKTSGAGLKP